MSIKYFSLDHNTPINYNREIIGGLTNFMAIAYIIIVNPAILNAAGKGFPINASITAPDFSLFMQIDWLGSLKPSFISAISSLFIVNFFDATSSVIGLLTQLEYKDSTLKQTYYKRALIFKLKYDAN